MLLYTISGAPRGWRVQMGLLFKGLDYDLRLLQGSAAEHKKEPYLQTNPRGTVPTLEHEGHRITDSIGILAWLDRTHPERPLFGSSPEEAATIWSLTTELEDFLRPAQHAFVFPILVERKDFAEPEDRAAHQAFADHLLTEFQNLEDRLADASFLIGDAPSAADAVAYPEVRLIGRLREKQPQTAEQFGYHTFPEQFPRIAAWQARIEQMPGYHQSLPHHWSN